MITPKKKICKCCETEQYVWSKGCCKKCASKNYHKVNKVSIKQVETNKILHGIYTAMETTEKKCFVCGCTNNLTHQHIVRRSYSDVLTVNPLNIIFLCLDCHKIADDKPKERLYMNNYIKVLKRMRLLDKTYFNIEMSNIKEIDIDKYNQFISEINLESDE